MKMLAERGKADGDGKIGEEYNQESSGWDETLVAEIQELEITEYQSDGWTGTRLGCVDILS